MNKKPGETQQKQVDEIIEYYKIQSNASSQENLTSMLREIQELLGCIPEDVQDDISKELNIKPIIIRQLIKLFPSLTSAPRRHKIVVCVGRSCSGNHAEGLLEALRKAIRNRPFILTTKNCMKQCRTAPNLQIDDDFYAGVSEKDIAGILEKYV